MTDICPINGTKLLGRHAGPHSAYLFSNEYGDRYLISATAFENLSHQSSPDLAYRLDGVINELKDQSMVPFVVYTPEYGYEITPIGFSK